MKRTCPDCNKRYVTSKENQRMKRDCAPQSGDELLCDLCFKDVCQIAYDHSYFGSIQEWGAINSVVE